MTIKQIEEAVGMTSANIRFYEKEQLISPLRNEANNYREYREEDIVRLKKIKLLRALGVSVADIRTLLDDPGSLTGMMEERIAQIHTEQKNLEEIEEICGYIMRQQMDFETLDVEILEEQADHSMLKEKLKYVLKADISEEEITRAGFNKIITGMMVYSLLFGAGICFFLGAHFNRPPAEGEIITCLGILMGSALLIYLSSKLIVQVIAFQAVTCVLAPAVLMVSPKGFRNGAWIFFLILAVYVLYLGTAVVIKERFMLQIRYTAVLALCGTAAGTACLYVITDMSVKMLAVFAGCALYIAVNWSGANRKVEHYNKYYAVVSAIRIINIPAFLVEVWGMYSMGNWRRDGRTFNS